MLKLSDITQRQAVLRIHLQFFDLFIHAGLMSVCTTNGHWLCIGQGESYQPTPRLLTSHNRCPERRNTSVFRHLTVVVEALEAPKVPKMRSIGHRKWFHGLRSRHWWLLIELRANQYGVLTDVSCTSWTQSFWVSSIKRSFRLVPNEDRICITFKKRFSIENINTNGTHSACQRVNSKWKLKRRINWRILMKHLVFAVSDG